MWAPEMVLRTLSVHECDSQVINTRSVFPPGEVFVPPTEAPKPIRTGVCLRNYGLDYTGDLAVTLGGHTCLQWSLPEVKALSQDKDFIPEVGLQGNKCRNPDNDFEGPWCYVEVSGNVTVDYCDLELCGNKDCLSPRHLCVCVTCLSL